MGKASALGGITHEQLVELLAVECRVEQIKAEDFLFALRDIVIDNLLAGKNICVKGFGRWRRLDAPQRPVRFCMDHQMVARLGATRKINVSLCIRCGKNPPRKNYRTCQACRREQDLRRDLQKRKAK